MFNIKILLIKMSDLEEIIDNYIREHPSEVVNICEYNPTLLIKAVYLTQKIPELNILIKNYVKLHPDELNNTRDDNATALMRACNTAHNSTEETIQILIDAGADLNRQDKNGRTALIMSSLYSNDDSTEQTVKILINAGADLNIKNIYGCTALIEASRFSRTTSTEQTIKMLINAGADINIRDSSGITALIHASGNSNGRSSEESVKILIDAGANLNIQNNNGDTALIVASRKRYSTEETIKMLINAGADLNIINNNKMSAFNIFIYNNADYLENDIFDLFIRLNANLNITDNIILKLIEKRQVQMVLTDQKLKLEIDHEELLTKLKYHPDKEFIESVNEHLNLNKIEQRITLFVDGTIESLIDQISNLEVENEYLCTELECHPDSEFVKHIKEQFEFKKLILS